MRTICLTIFTLFCTLPHFGQQTFSKEQVLEDLAYLRESLEEAHYNLYTYVTKEAFDRNYEEVKSMVDKDSLSLLETTSLFQAVISKANNGHTEISFPGSSYGAYANAGGTLFPLEIAFENGKALIRKNWSTNPALTVGSQIISINEQPIEKVLAQMYPLLSAERRYFKLAKLELYSFPRLYWQAFGEQKAFTIEVLKEGTLERFEINSIHLINDYEMKRSDPFSGERTLQFFKHAAYVNPGNFGGDEEKYQAFIDSAFVEINEKNLPNLIIDLRNNLGGNDSFSDYLMSYIADQPFQWSSEFSLKTSAILKAHVRKHYDVTQPFWKSVITHKDGSIYPYTFEKYDPQPIEKRFVGKVYVLINRQTHSQAAVTAAQIQDYELATIVGEETGDFPSLYASQYNYNLPNTGINVKISKGYIVRVNGSKKAEGVIPDIWIQDHLLDEDDEILTGLLKHIEKNEP